MRKINELKDKTIMDRFSLYFCFLNLHKDRLNSPVYYPYELQFVEYSFMEYLKCLEKYNNYRDEVDRRGLAYKIHYDL